MEYKCFGVNISSEILQDINNYAVNEELKKHLERNKISFIEYLNSLGVIYIDITGRYDEEAIDKDLKNPRFSYLNMKCKKCHRHRIELCNDFKLRCEKCGQEQ